MKFAEERNEALSTHEALNAESSGFCTAHMQPGRPQPHARGRVNLGL